MEFITIRRCWTLSKMLQLLMLLALAAPFRSADCRFDRQAKATRLRRVGPIKCTSLCLKFLLSCATQDSEADRRIVRTWREV